MDNFQVIFEKIYACKGQVLLRDLVNFLRALDDDIDDNVKVNKVISNQCLFTFIPPSFRFTFFWTSLRSMAP